MASETENFTFFVKITAFLEDTNLMNYICQCNVNDIRSSKRYIKPPNNTAKWGLLKTLSIVLTFYYCLQYSSIGCIWGPFRGPEARCNPKLNGKFEKIYSLCIPCSEFAFANYKKNKCTIKNLYGVSGGVRVLNV